MKKFLNFDIDRSSVQFRKTVYAARAIYYLRFFNKGQTDYISILAYSTTTNQNAVSDIIPLIGIKGNSGKKLTPVLENLFSKVKDGELIRGKAEPGKELIESPGVYFHNRDLMDAFNKVFGVDDYHKKFMTLKGKKSTFKTFWEDVDNDIEKDGIRFFPFYLNEVLKEKAMEKNKSPQLPVEEKKN